MSKTYEVSVPRELTLMHVELRKMIDRGRALHVEVKSQATKTQKQLGYWHGVVVPRVREGLYQQGNEMSHAEVNTFLNELFYSKSKTIVIKRGLDEHVYTLRTPRSKSGATKDEMSAVIDKVIRWAATELVTIIPPPNNEWLETAEGQEDVYEVM